MAVLGLHFCLKAFLSCGNQGLPFVAMLGLLIVVVSPLAEHRFSVGRLQWLWPKGFVALRHVGFSRTRDQMCVPCMGWCFLNHNLSLLLSCSVVSDSATPWTAARQAALSFTIPWSLLKLMSIELMMPSNHFILCCPLLLLSSIATH